jgi:hypothetical protein
MRGVVGLNITQLVGTVYSLEVSKIVGIQGME